MVAPVAGQNRTTVGHFGTPQPESYFHFSFATLICPAMHRYIPHHCLRTPVSLVVVSLNKSRDRGRMTIMDQRS
jgi:hypothetical protein